LEIAYSNNRKPFFINSPLHLSISHSKNYIAIAVAPYPIGMDIEECHDRIFKVSNRFLNQSEKELFNHESSRDLTFAWSAKEALFKLNVNVGLDFKSDLIITDWDKKSMIRARMIENSEWRNVNLHSMMHENLVICFNFE
jgi:phosphopantetheinyl transferase